MAMHKPKKQRRFQDGGDVNEAEMKQRGLDASNKEAPVGFFERLRMGNIDDPNSEAYKKFGAGRGRQDRDDADFAAEEARDKTARAQAGKASDGDVSPYDLRTEAAANAPSRVSTNSGQSSSGRKPSAAPKVVQAPKTRDNAAPEASQKGKTASEYSRSSDEMRNLTRQKAAVSTMPSSVYDADTDRMRNQSRKQARFEGSKRMASTPEAQAKRKAMEKSQALERVTPEEYLLPGASLKALHKQAAKLAKPKIREYNPTTLPAPKAAAKAETKSLPAPQKKLSYDKGSVKAGERTRRAESRSTQMQKDNDARYGVDTASKGYNPNRSRTGESRFNIGRGETKKSSTEVMDVAPKSTTPKPAPKKRSPRLMSEKKAKAATIGLGVAGVGGAAGAYAEKMVRQKKDRDSEVGMKKGGRVTASSASKRADGIAQRGKTRGRMY